MELAVLTKMIFTLIGGLGIFLLGMKSMSDGMQAVAGSRLRGLISLATNNRFLATGVGVVVTCVVQSSSITTVMVVGFVNSGVMQLAQALGVIMGANIGTTVTGWILVLKIGKYGLPILGAAAIIYLFSKGDRLRFWAMVIMGIGMIFFGLELMKDACSLIKEHPNFESWFQSFQANDYLGSTGMCPHRLFAHHHGSIVFGDPWHHNFIGFAGRDQLSHCGCLGPRRKHWYDDHGLSCLTRSDHQCTPGRLFPHHLQPDRCLLDHGNFHWYIELVQWVVGADVTKVIMVDGKQTYDTTATIAATHSIFNITNTLLFLPFLPLFVKLLEEIRTGKGIQGETAPDGSRYPDP